MVSFPKALLGCSVLFVFLVSCHSLKTADFAGLPPDEATPEEREKINNTLQNISNIAAQFGYEDKFTLLPVLVTSEDTTVTKRLGYCQRDQNRQGLYIVLNRENFEIEKSRPYLQAVFNVLLHEIGHCYFGKDHSDELLLKQGYLAKVEVSNESGGSDFFEEGFPVSIMYTGVSARCLGTCLEGSSVFGDIKEFESYYISELIGTQKKLSIVGLSAYKSFKWVPSEQ